MIQWQRDKVQEDKQRRNWKALPAQFEADAVKFTFSLIKPHFQKNEIKQRIAASRATTYEELERATS